MHPRTPARTRRRRIDGEYVIEADGSIGFRIGPHDPDAMLVVDPSLSIAYGTFLGGLGSDTAASIAIDHAGKIYVGGTTTSTAFPGAPASKIGPADGPAQFFIAKIDPTLAGASSLVYLTFIGAGGTQAGGLIAVDEAGDVAITGTTTATDFPVTDTTEPTSALASGYGNDTIVSEIGPAGNNLIFSTLFGGSGTESQAGPGGIALDSAGDVYIASDVQTTAIDSASADLPVTPEAFQTAWDGEPADGFLAIFQPPTLAGKAAILKYCSYLGTNSNGQPGVGGIAVDISGNAYIAGFSSNLPNGFPTKNAIQTVYGGGGSDAFLMKISPAGNGATDLVYGTLLGGSGSDEALAVALDSSNPPNAYVAGTTQSPNFPVNGAVGAYQPSLHASATANAFLSVVSQNAITGQSALAYSTYFGGSRIDAGQGVAVAAPNAVFLTGATTSADLPWHDNLQAFNGAGDAFVAKFNPTAPGVDSFIYVTPLGGTSPAGGTASAVGNAVAVDQAGHVYVAGASTSADFPTAVTTASAMNGFEASCSSCQMTPPLSDAFVAEIVESASPMPSVYFNVGRVPFLPGPIGTASDPQPIAVFNGGEASLTISDIEIAGANAADFSLLGGGTCLGQAISPGPTVKCSFEVGFTPSSLGPEVAVVAVFDNAPGSPQVLELVATGQAPAAAISPLNLNFGDQPQNSTSAIHIVTMTNAGSQTLKITGVVEGGPDSAVFARVQIGDPGTGSCQANVLLAPGAQCVAKFSFEPNAVRTFHAEVDFFDSSGQLPSTEQIVSLTGIGTATAPIVNLSASSLTFGSEIIGSRSGAQSVTLTNQGSAALSIASIALAGTNAADFAILATGTTCPVSGGTLVVQATCTVAVQLAPQTPGPKTASLAFTDNAAASPQQVSVTGNATSQPSLQVSPSGLTFPAQSEGIASTAQSITILNAGAGPAEITGIAISGPNAADYTSPASCTPNPVAAGKSCQIGVTFMPGTATPGIRSATLSVPAGIPATVALSGTATQASISVPTSINFGSQLAGGSGGSPQPVVITNSSSGAFAGALTIASVAKSGANPGDFALVTDACTGASTPPGATCSVQVAFKPLQPATCGATGGSRSATLTLNDNAPGSPHSIPLGGTAMDFCIASSPGQAVVEPIAAGQSAIYLLEVDSSAGLSGTASLSCSVPAQLLGSCSISTTPATNPPVAQISSGSPSQFKVVVTTIAPGTAVVVNRARPGTAMRPGGRQILRVAILWLAVLMTWTLGRRPGQTKIAQVGALLLACAIAMAACGGGGGGTPAVSPPPGTPAGTYVITLTATVNLAGQPSVTRTFPLSLTVD
ncbi:MAG: choice-of-anchor D domain-containing protein [Candidatus Acidiferrales bacterium]